MTAYMEMHGLLKARAGWAQSDKATKSMDGRIKSRKTVIVRELPRIPRLEELAGLAPSFCFSQQLVDNLMKGAPLLLVVLALAAQPASCIFLQARWLTARTCLLTPQPRHATAVESRRGDRTGAAALPREAVPRPHARDCQVGAHLALLMHADRHAWPCRAMRLCLQQQMHWVRQWCGHAYADRLL